MFNHKIQLLALTLLVCTSFCAQAQKEPPVETLEIKEVSERAVTLDQTTFRLKFYYRQNINQIDADHYWVRVFDLDYNHICVVFPKEGLNFFKKVVTQEDSYKKFKNSPYYGTSSGSASGIYVTAHAITEENKPAWWQNYTFNSNPTPMMVLDAIGKGASKNISGEAKFKW